MSKKVLGVIPARGGSKGVIDKNIKLLGDKPLIQYAIEAAKKSLRLTRTIISTDSDKIAKIAKDCGGDVPFMRPKQLATDSSLSVDVVLHSIKEMQSAGEEYDFVLLLQPTNPFRTSFLIDQSIATLVETNCDSVVSFVDVGANHPARMYRIKNDKPSPLMSNKNNMMPRQELPKIFIRSGDIYGCKTSFILSNGQLMGGDCRSIIVDQKHSINIDSKADFILANELLGQI